MACETVCAIVIQTPRREAPMRTPPDEILYPGMSGPSEPVWSAPSHERPQYDEPPRLDDETVAAVERTMKKYGDNLMRVLEGLSGRLQRLEGSTGRLESAVSQLQQQGNNRHGETDGALRSLTNDIHEASSGSCTIINFICLL